MRITPICLAALLVAAPAHAANAPQVTDPRGDANFTRTGVATDPASVAAYDITAVRWWADASGQHVTVSLPSADPRASARYVVTAATPACDTVTVEWRTGGGALLAGCLPRQRRGLPAPVWSAGALTFTLPLPSWFAKGTTVHGLGAEASPVYDVVVGAAYPQADTASSAATYVLGT